MNTSSNTAKEMKEQTILDILQSGEMPSVATQFDIFEIKEVAERLIAFDDVEAGIYNDTDTKEIASNDLTFAKVKFDNRKRVGDAIAISKHLYNDTKEEVIGTLKPKQVQRTLKTYAKQALGHGNKDGSGLQFQSILDYNSQDEKELIKGIKINDTFKGVTTETIVSAIGEYVQNNTAKSIIVVNSLADVINLTDASGALVLKTEQSANGSVGTIFGSHTFVVDMNGKAKMVVMNPKAYGVGVKAEYKNPYSAANAVHTSIIDILSQGKVLDPNGIKIIKDATA
ncbi:hypothetical protein [Lysinibacillus sp. TE18511]